LIDGTNTLDNLITHDQFAEDRTLAYFLSRMTEVPDLPHPIGIFRSVEHPCYEDMMTQQIDTAKQRMGEGDLEALLNAGDTWVVE
jgi:2-oxoglutarate ferredoxin oxidoreductase subunit beta